MYLLFGLLVCFAFGRQQAKGGSVRKVQRLACHRDVGATPARSLYGYLQQLPPAAFAFVARSSESILKFESWNDCKTGYGRNGRAGSQLGGMVGLSWFAACADWLLATGYSVDSRQSSDDIVVVHSHQSVGLVRFLWLWWRSRLARGLLNACVFAGNGVWVGSSYILTKTLPSAELYLCLSILLFVCTSVCLFVCLAWVANNTWRCPVATFVERQFGCLTFHQLLMSKPFVWKVSRWSDLFKSQ